jgi:hypothetical protein
MTIKTEKFWDGFNLGAKAICVLEGAQSEFVAAKCNYYGNNIYNENPKN